MYKAGIKRFKKFPYLPMTFHHNTPERSNFLFPKHIYRTYFCRYKRKEVYKT